MGNRKAKIFKQSETARLLFSDSSDLREIEREGWRKATSRDPCNQAQYPAFWELSRGRQHGWFHRPAARVLIFPFENNSPCPLSTQTVAMCQDRKSSWGLSRNTVNTKQIPTTASDPKWLLPGASYRTTGGYRSAPSIQNSALLPPGTLGCWLTHPNS